MSVAIREVLSTRATRTSRSTGETASHYRHLEFEWSDEEGRAIVNSTTHTSRTTGETASHHRHLKFEQSYDEGKAPVNSYDLYESYNW